MITTLDPTVQDVARQALEGQTGAIAALDPRTGAILALVLPPQLRPQPAGQSRRRRGACGVGRPRDRPGGAARATGRRPSSIHQARRSRSWSPRPRWRAASTRTARSRTRSESTPPQTTATIGNFGGGLCNGGAPITLAARAGGQLQHHLRAAWLGAGRGPGSSRRREALRLQCRGALRRAPRGERGPGGARPPVPAQSAIGQRDVRVTAVQMAMIGGGDRQRRRAHGPADGRPRSRTSTGAWCCRCRSSRYTPPGQPGPQAVQPQRPPPTLTEMMVRRRGVAAAARRAQIAGIAVAGKTGTAQTGEGQQPTVWFVAFAPAEDPQVAVAVVVPTAATSATRPPAARVAAPIARAVMEAALRARRTEKDKERVGRDDAAAGQPRRVLAGRYALQGLLGQGGMADVELAHDQVLDRQVAVKILHPRYADDPSFLERFRREAQAAASLNHPNMVAVYDTGDEEGGRSSSWSTCRAQPARGAAPRGRAPRAAPPRSASRPRWPCTSPTSAASCTATSNPPTSWSPTRAR